MKKQQRQEQRRADSERRRRRRAQILVLLLVGALVVAMAVGLITSLVQSSDSATPEPDASGVATEEAVAAGQCPYLDSVPDASVVTDVGRPDTEPGDLGDLTAVLTLNDQAVTLALDGSAAPCTANSWEFLAAADYFDDTTCHRLSTSETLGVLQCGDPSGTGFGGPGYRFAEENVDGATYPVGTVAMANTGQPVTTGSQFFLVHSDSELPASFTVVGTVTDGLEVVQDIAAAGTVDGGTDGAPATAVDVADLVVERNES